MRISSFAFFELATVALAWMPASGKLRGVNLGSQFVIEPWMVMEEWMTMGCNGTQSEFDCVAALGQTAANKAFQDHWARWINETDLDKMASLGLNTIRIPVGFWMNEDLVNATEHFPQGGFRYLERICKWSAERGFYVIIDLHGAPAAQTRWQAFTGMWVSYPGFYNSYNYDRAYKFLTWLTEKIHTNPSFRTVGMIEVINEPEWDFPSVISTLYPRALSQIQAKERLLNVPPSKRLHVQFMDTKWGAGNPNQNLTSNTGFLAYDNHRYLKSDPTVPTTRAAGETPLVIGEWSLGPATAAQDGPEFTIANGTNIKFYQQWWAAQVRAYERSAGWAFWSWKAQLNGDWRWGYLDAVEAGVIPKHVTDAYKIGGCVKN
ncbi:putative glucan endo-1,6-beta-glucosidase B [Leptodontidium sp. MPI-SDFR-AT-0119]|nr:putative glucan endo-1,6-beta-glucosidase B [Leptodontidium sp. MPI-SDFR-AT-0119]